MSANDPHHHLLGVSLNSFPVSGQPVVLCSFLNSSIGMRIQAAALESLANYSSAGGVRSVCIADHSLSAGESLYFSSSVPQSVSSHGSVR